MNKKHGRHHIKRVYSLAQELNYKIVDIDTTNWTDITAQGFANFVQKNVPNWKTIIITKNTLIIDPKKKTGEQVVSTKQAMLRIAVNGSGGLCFEVDENMKKDGKIPSHILNFFGEQQR